MSEQSGKEENLGKAHSLSFAYPFRDPSELPNECKGLLKECCNISGDFPQLSRLHQSPIFCPEVRGRLFKQLKFFKIINNVPRVNNRPIVIVIVISLLTSYFES